MANCFSHRWEKLFELNFFQENRASNWSNQTVKIVPTAGQLAGVWSLTKLLEIVDVTISTNHLEGGKRALSRGIAEYPKYTSVNLHCIFCINIQ